MNDFLINIAPFLVLIATIIVGFWAALKDEPVVEDEGK